MNRTMRIIGLGAVLAGLAAAAAWNMSARAPGAPAAPAGARPKPRPATIPPTVIGMNAGLPAYYSGEWAFADLIKNNADFTLAGQVPLGPLLNAGGWPTAVPKGKELDLFVDAGPYFRSGTYECAVSPGWYVVSRFAGTVAQKGERFRLTIPADVQPGFSVQLRLRAEQPGANLTRLSCLPAGRPAELLNPAFVADMKPFRVIRFMDWMKTNNQGRQTWAGRPLPGDVSIVPRGASVEDMVEVANRLGSDPWFTLPLDADADYHRNFAAYVRDHLAPGRKAYIELSNEVWNGSFQQSKDATARGRTLYAGADEQKATDYYYADRIRETMGIWAQVFAGHMDRIVRVAASQAVWKERAEDILAHKDTWRSVDALATAPYFGAMIQDIPESGKARVDKVLARLPAQADEAIRHAQDAKAIADRYGLAFMAYEAGPDVVGFTPEAGADAKTIVHDPRLYAIYMDFLKKWQTRVGGLLVLYDNTGASTYSHNDHTGQPLAEAPKMRAVTDFANGMAQAKP